MPLRLLCCSGSLEGGGSERQLWQLATRVDPARIRAEIYLLYRRGDFLTQLPADFPVHAFWSQRTPRRFYLPGQIARQQVSHLSRVIRQRGIQVVYDRTFHMTLLTAAACRQTRTPRVSVIVSPPSFDFHRSHERFRWFKRSLLARAYQDPQNTVLTVSNSVAEDAAKYYGLDRQRILTLPSPIDCVSVQRDSQHALPTLLPSMQDPTLIVAIVGRLSVEKGQRLVIEALSQLRKTLPTQAIHLLVVGDGPDRDALQRLTADLTLQDRVHFVGRQANPYPWIKAAGLLCIASEYEGLPNVALEGMCLGRPIVATNCSGSLQELLGSGQRGTLVSPGDVSALMAAIQNRIDDAAAWQQRADRASDWVRSHHGLDNWLERMQQLFEQRVQSWKRRSK